MGSEDVREILGRKRTVEILDYLSSSGVQNFSEVESAIDTSSDTLADSLELLQEYDLVEREKRSKKDVRYEITEKGERFLGAVRTIDEILRSG